MTTTTSTATDSSVSNPDDILPGSDIELSFPWRSAPERTLDDVGGMENLKQELRRSVIRPLGPKRDEYERFGIDVPNLLFGGPPGTGKTYSATALAGELGYPFVVLTAGRLQSRWVNESTDHVQRLFREAARIGEEHGQAVIIADELDTLLPRRGGDEKHQEDNKVVTEFLAYLERTAENNTLFIGATNRPDELDEAVIRNGRIDRRFKFTAPNKPTRTAILEQQLADRPARVSSEELSRLAAETEGATAATLTTIVNEAARNAVEQGAAAIAQTHLDEAVAEHFVDGD
ncbi:ATP-binding protein [Halobellus marinus]|uniref:ATP-binding protein n=1 Tax=Halobellus TaxID=1073986 RepID=UPI0028A9673F|nr:ATP-binding protein [Halobellus sp. DFY28]